MYLCDMKKITIAETVKLVKYQLSIYKKTKAILKKSGFIIFFLPLFAHAQLPTPIQDNQVPISKNRAWALSNASLNLGVNGLLNITGTQKLLDTVTNASGGYTIRGAIDATGIPINGAASISVTYTDENGLLQNQTLYYTRINGKSNWGGSTIICKGGTRLTVWANGGKAYFFCGVHEE